MSTSLAWQALTVAVADVWEVDEEFAGSISEQRETGDVINRPVRSTVPVRVQNSDGSLVVEII